MLSPMNSEPVTLLQKVSRVAFVICLLLMAVQFGMTVKALLEHGWTFPWWTWNQAPTQEMQVKGLLFERFQYWHGVFRQLLYYGLFAALFQVFGKGRVFTRQSVFLVQCLALVLFVNSLLNVAGPSLCGLPFNNLTALLYEIDYLLLSSVVLIAAWVLKEGCRMQEDQALTV